MRAQLMALYGIESALQQRAKDGRLDARPVALGGGEEKFELVLSERKGVLEGEEVAVETL